MSFKKSLFALVAAIASVATSLTAHAGERYNELDDAVTAQVKLWQSGAKAKPIMSSDGKVIFPFGQAMPQLTCSPVRACDIEMEPGETPRKVILGDGQNWQWEGADSIEKGKTVNHIVIQPKDSNLETNAIITTDRRTYHIKLLAPTTEGVFLNRVGFYYPESLVSSWDDKMAFDYDVDGDADFRPLRVFNDGERTYIAMPEEIRHSEYPTLSLIDDKGNYMVVDYRRTVDEKTNTIYYVVDKLFSKAELHRDDDKVRIEWKRKKKTLFSSWGER